MRGVLFKNYVIERFSTLQEKKTMLLNGVGILKSTTRTDMAELRRGNSLEKPQVYDWIELFKRVKWSSSKITDGGLTYLRFYSVVLGHPVYIGRGFGNKNCGREVCVETSYHELKENSSGDPFCGVKRLQNYTKTYGCQDRNLYRNEKGDIV